MNQPITRTAARGMSIVELMVAITIGLIILAAVSTVFVSSKSNYTTQESSARLQESARFAMNFISQDLRMAGYFGCADDLQTIHNNLNPGGISPAFDFSIPIEGSEAGTTVFYPSGSATKFPTTGAAATSQAANCPGFVGGRCTGTDAFALRRADPASISLTTAMPNTSAALFIEPNNGLQIGDIILLSDCAGAELFQITNIQNNVGPNSDKQGVVHNTGGGSPSPGNAQKFERAYGPPGAKIMKFVQRAYYIGTGTNGQPTLFRQNLDGTNLQELVEGIEDMQVTFGYGSYGDKTPRVYLPANDGSLGATKANWSNVVSARIEITARPVLDTSPNNPNKVQPKTFVSTIFMRNLK